jgi:ribonuclease G
LFKHACPTYLQTLVIVEKELIIHSTSTEVEIALLENGKLVELNHEEIGNDFAVGDIFLGKIRKLMPGLNAAFVDIGHKKDAFLHYTDMGPKLKNVLKYTDSVMANGINTANLDNFRIEPDINKNGKVDQVLAKRQHILVQILKEPIGTKGPRLSCEITIPGRFLVLTPFTDVIAVSKKIASSEERKRLQNIAESIKPKNFGVIVRTAAEGKNTAELHEEMMQMTSKWDKIFFQLKQAQPPAKLLSELDKTTSILRDLLNESFSQVVVDDKDIYESVKNYLSGFSPDQMKIVQLYKNSKHIFDHYGIHRQIKSAFGKTATMTSGAYLVVEHTEAMHVIDVNSGHKVGSASTDDAILAVNMEAAEEIARQLRLRDLGGLIVIDFIDMRDLEHKKTLQKAMKDFMIKDRAQHTILPLSKFGLMQITRQRVRPELTINTAEMCPSCAGSGKIQPTVLLTDDIDRDLDSVLQARPKGKMFLHVHPFVEAYLKKGFPNKVHRWYLKYQKWVHIKPEPEYPINVYKFFNDNEDEIRLG